MLSKSDLSKPKHDACLHLNQMSLFWPFNFMSQALIKHTRDLKKTGGLGVKKAYDNSLSQLHY